MNKLCVRQSALCVYTHGKMYLLFSGEENNQSYCLLKFLVCFIWSCAHWVNFSFQSCQKDCFGVLWITSSGTSQSPRRFYFSNEVANLNMNCGKILTLFLTSSSLVPLICFTLFVSVCSKPCSWYFLVLLPAFTSFVSDINQWL